MDVSFKMYNVVYNNFPTDPNKITCSDIMSKIYSPSRSRTFSYQNKVSQVGVTLSTCYLAGNTVIINILYENLITYH